ncbi:pilus assembly protein PilM [Pelotomaculum isophthalicicum JI]|uniref:Pilus assembly protein PilM n=1 Tax=Pelotomaculum isophthalicicum JI TaxID=947010 RepID=A0A9X4H762_9FIRM|nr:pilus assembly protein PilM [Pelotomaculum isophthalicicum]MDF9409767.1 pilus assembly protein PilM [Pelotomaculum isophthalicicum JI]
MLNKLSSAKLYLDMHGKVVRLVEGFSSKSGAVTIKKHGTVLFEGVDAFPPEPDFIPNNAGILKSFVKEQNIRTKKVVLCLGQPGIIARAVKVPMMSPADLKTHMEMEISDYLPVSSEEYSFDYKVMSVFNEDDRDFFNVMAAAALIKHIEQCVAIVETAGFKPIAIDIFPNVMWKLFADKYRDTAVVDSGRDGTRLMLCHGEDLVLYTDIPYQFENQGEEDLSLLTREISGYLDFFASRHFGKTVDNIYVTGELSANQNMRLVLEGMLNIPVSPGLQDDDSLELKGNLRGFKEIVSVYAGNIGLMLREV